MSTARLAGGAGHQSRKAKDRPEPRPVPRLALASRSYDMGALAACLRSQRPGWSIDVWPDAACMQAEVLVGWNCPPGLVQAMPNLRLVHGIAAGIDNLVAGQDIGVLPVCRVVDEQQVVGMGQYVLWSVLQFHRGLDLALAQQARREWRKPLLRDAGDWRVGIMGLGAMGAHCARLLVTNGYAVRGWSRTPRDIDGVQGFHGDDALPAFLHQLDTLVCLLPLTPATRGILGRATFGHLPRGATLVHVGRGEHLVPADLQAALADGRLRGAIVDVFAREPLPADDALWSTPGLIVTPHMATMATLASIGGQIVANVERLMRGEPLAHRVDVAGYASA